MAFQLSYTQKKLESILVKAKITSDRPCMRVAHEGELSPVQKIRIFRQLGPAEQWLSICCTGCARGFNKAIDKILSPWYQHPLRVAGCLIREKKLSHFLSVAMFCVLNIATVATFN